MQVNGDVSYIKRILLLLNDNIKNSPISRQALSKRMDMNRNYLEDLQKRTGKYDQYIKFFDLAINLLLIDLENFKFKSNTHYERFREGSLELIFQEMVRKGVYSDELVINMQKAQFKTISNTLYALTKAMYNKFSEDELNQLREGRSNKFLYSLTRLSNDIGGVETLSQTLRYEMFITPEKIALIKSIINQYEAFAFDECRYAKELIEEIPRLRTSKRSAYVGRTSHPILENFFRKVWLLKMKIQSNHEFEFNRPRSNHRIDTFLDVRNQKQLKDLLKISSDKSLKNYKTMFIDYIIPSLKALKKCVFSKLSPDKHYLAKDRALIIVFYGSYSDKIFEEIKKLLNKSSIPYKNNVRFMDIMDFAALFNLDEINIQRLKDINQIIKDAMLGNDKSLETLEAMSNSALYELSRADKRKS